MMRKVVVIGDAHASPETGELERFSAAGKFILHERPTDIVIIGDFITLDSLSFWDKNKRLKMEGRRFSLDVDAGNTALNYLLSSINIDNSRRKANHKRLYVPNIHYLEGNHEERLRRYIEYDAVLDGTLSVESELRLASRNIQWTPYGSYLSINNVLFTHIPFSGNGRPYSSNGMQASLAKKILLASNRSVVYGHTHKLEIAHTTRREGEQIHAINVGCFTSDVPEPYAENSVDDSWRGLVVLYIEETGGVSKIKTVSKTEILNEWS